MIPGTSAPSIYCYAYMYRYIYISVYTYSMDFMIFTITMPADASCLGTLLPNCSSSTRPRCRTWISSTCEMSQLLGRTPAVRCISISPRLWVYVYGTYYRLATSILLIKTFTCFQSQRAPAIMRNFGWRFMKVLSFTMEVAQTGST